ncbi:MAG: flagellar basal body P-ring formation protein FlgA [Methylothermaceae bacterium]|nr:flagellar basal body P-ring formation protein FlgA [Methylothermaceae bacterium]
MTMRWILVVCLLSLAVSLKAEERNQQSLESIRQAVASHLESIIRQEHRDFDIKVNSLDPRLRLTHCDQPLAISLLRDKTPVGAVSVGVACRGSHPWTIYVRANVRLFQKVAVLARSLAKGTVLEEAMVILKRTDIADLRGGYFSTTESALGKRLTRSLPAGAVLTRRELTSLKIVHKGDAVMIRARGGGLDVRMGGHALMDGGLGERIRVRNDRSQRVVEGVVRGPNEVRVVF